MIKLQNVCYVRLGTRDLEGATRFATDILGLEVSEWAKGARHFKSDEREHTLCYLEGDPSIQIAGFEVANKDDHDQAAAELEKLGHAVHVGTRAGGRRAHGARLHRLPDPTGNRIEIAWRPAVSGPRYLGTRDAGITGFSHIGLCTTDPARDEAFWTQVCNARVSDRIGDAAAAAHRRDASLDRAVSRPIGPASSTSTIRSRPATTSCARCISSMNAGST